MDPNARPDLMLRVEYLDGTEVEPILPPAPFGVVPEPSEEPGLVEEAMEEDTSAVEEPGPVEPQVAPLNEADVVQQVKTMYNFDRDASDAIREIWKTNWDLYQNRFDDSKKAEWQSRHVLATMGSLIDFLAPRFSDDLTNGDPNWAGMTFTDRRADILKPIFQKLWLHNQEGEEFLGRLESVIKSGLLAAPVWKVYPIEGEDAPFPGYCRIEPVDCRLFLRDHSGFKGHHIQLTPMHAEDLEKKHQEYGFDPEAVKDIVKGRSQDPMSGSSGGFGGLTTGASLTQASDLDWVRDASRVHGFSHSEKYHRTVVLVEYWGPLWNGVGDMVAPYGCAVVANGRRALKVQPKQLEESPYVDCDVVEVPFAAYGKAPAENIASLCKAETAAFRVMMDNAARSSSDITAVNRKILTARSKAAMRNGVQPGGTYEQTGEGTLFTVQALAEFHPEMLMILEFLNQKIQAYSATPDFVRGMPQEKGRTVTLGEAQMKAGAAGAALKGIAGGIEKRMLQPLVEKWIRFMSARLDLSDPRVMAIAGEEIVAAVNQVLSQTMMLPAPVTPEHQLYFLGLKKLQDMVRSRVTVQVSGITHKLLEAEMIQKMEGLIGTAAALPGAIELIDVPKFLRMLAKQAGIRPDDVFVEGMELIHRQMLVEARAGEMVQELMAMEGGMEGGGGSSPPAKKEGGGTRGKVSTQRGRRGGDPSHRGPAAVSGAGREAGK